MQAERRGIEDGVGEQADGVMMYSCAVRGNKEGVITGKLEAVDCHHDQYMGICFLRKNYTHTIQIDLAAIKVWVGNKSYTEEEK